jgi:hypothetical protein
MVAIALTDNLLRATDRVNRTFELEVSGWDELPDGPEIPIDLDETVSGRVVRIDTPDVLAEYMPLDGEYETIDKSWRTTELPDDEYLLKLTGKLVAYVRFDGPARIDRAADGSVTLSFDQPQPVTVGVWSLVAYPEETVVVDPTPEGIATGISALSSAHLTESPDRILPGWRRHPPRIEFGENTGTPDDLDVPDTDIELAVPDRIEPLFPAAPLSFHLGADVLVEPDREAPQLRVPGRDLVHEFAPTPEFQFEAASLFRRVVYLDRLVRTGGPRGNDDLLNCDILDAARIDPETWYERPIADRLERYLDVPPELVTDLPRRNYATYIEPVPENVCVLPFVLRQYGQVYLPSAVRGERFNRPPKRRLEGWLAPGTASGTFEMHPRSPEHALEHLTESDPGISIVVVDAREGGRMPAKDRLTGVLDRYEGGSAAVEPAVEVRENVGVGELVTLLESRTDLVHYVGNVVDGGLQAADGRVDVTSLDDPSPRIAVLDAPNSVAVGRTLVDQGGVLAITTGNRRAPGHLHDRVAMLLVQGFTAGVAVDLVSETFADAAVDLKLVGDGTHNLPEELAFQYLLLDVVSNGDRTFEVRAEPNGPTPGLAWHPEYISAESHVLESDATFRADAKGFEQQLSEPGFIVRYDGDLYRSADLIPFYPVV